MNASQINDLLHERRQQLGLDRLLPEERDYLLLWELHTEVSNGTFDQYLSNASGNHAQDALAVLKRLGSIDMARSLESAMAALPGGWCHDAAERSRRVALMPDRWNVFRSLTDQYYDAVVVEEDVVRQAAGAILPAYEREGLLG